MELPTNHAGFHKMRNLPLRNLPVVETMTTRQRGIPSRIGPMTRAAGALTALLFCGLGSAGYAQRPSADQTQPSQRTVPDAPAPPAEARPSGDPASGVVNPPDVDPKMAKPVPDVDPAMDNPPAGKMPAPAAPTTPKVQPK
jgi:hypothetical protein